MPPSASRPGPLAQQLLDAQVRHHLDRLTGDRLTETVAVFADDVLTAAGRHPIETLVDRDAVTQIVVRALGTVPASGAVGGILEMATTIAYDGPQPSFPIGDLADRAQVEALLDALLDASPALDQVLDRLTDSPLVGTVASRFMGRIVGEVMAANQNVANKVPGLGSLVSFGTGAASRVVGAADKQFESIVGRGLDQGGAFAVRGLNRILVETLRDPATREAALQVWDLIAEEPVAGLGSLSPRDDVDAIVAAVHDLVITALATDHAAALAEVVVEGFFDRFGGYTPTELLDELDIDRDDLVADVVRLAPAALDALRESGDLERLLRDRLEPFYASGEVAALLG